MTPDGRPGGPPEPIALRRAAAGEASVLESAVLADLEVEVADRGGAGATLDRGSTVARRFRSRPVAVSGLVVLVLLIAAAMLGPLVVHAEARPALTRAVLAGARQPPSWAHPFGTDKLGRDQLARMLVGLRVSLAVGFGVALLSSLVGVSIGTWAGWRRGWVDSLLMRFTDLFLVVPALVVLLVVASNPEPSFFGLFDLPPADRVPGMVLILSFLGWMPMARIVRGRVLSLRELEYVDAARAAGSSGVRIARTHLLPNLVGPIVVFATLMVGFAILDEAVLSFLGAGIQPPAISLGQMISEAEDTVGSDLSYLILWPGLVLFVLVLAVTLVGDGLRDAFDPKGRR